MVAPNFKTPGLANSRANNEYLTLAQQFQRYLELPVASVLMVAALFSITLFNLVDLAHDNEKTGVDLMILLKLGGLALGGICGAVGLLTMPKVRSILFSFPAIWMVIIFGFFCLSLPGADNQTEALASTLSIACVVTLTATALVQIGIVPVLMTIFYSLAAFVALSWGAFLFLPEIGVFEEPMADGFTARMCGLSHPNTLGQYAGITIVLGLILCRNYGQCSKWRYAIIAMAVGALVLSISRTSMLSTVVALVVVFRANLFQRKYFNRWIMLGTAGFFALAVMCVFNDPGTLIASKLGFLSKSGDVEELTSATGRTEIWSFALGLIEQRPLRGYGAAAANEYFEDYSYHAHNMLLNIAFSTGVFGGLAALFMCLGRVKSVILNRHPMVDPLIIYILVNGLFENAIFSTLAGMPTVIWTTAICLPCVLSCSIEAEENPGATASFGSSAGGVK